MHVGIVGAGPAGLTAAYALAKSGCEVEVFEAASAVGGMAKSIDMWRQTVDLGPHRFFSHDSRVNRLWLEVAGRDYEMINRLTRILYKGQFYHYPLRPFNALGNLGLREAALCLASYAREGITPTRLGDPPSFEEWVVRRFGRRLFGIFFKTYSEKLWGIPCSDLDAYFAAQRIKKFSLLEAIKNAIGVGSTRHTTMVDQFAYPLGGTGEIYRRMAADCEARGGRVHLNTPVRRIICEGDRAVALLLGDGRRASFDHIVSCMPITDLIAEMADVPAAVGAASARLRFRNTILVYLRIPSRDLFPDHWLYVHATDLTTGRITNFSNWGSRGHDAGNGTILALEYWCYSEDSIWREADETLVKLARDEISRCGLDGGACAVEGRVVRLKNAYPVYAKGYKTSLAVVIAHLRSIQGLSVIGRYGAFKYNNQDHSILMGMLAAQNICDGTQHDLWAINTGDEYQESSRITRLGLEPLD